MNKIHKINLTADTATYDIPEGFEVDRYLDISENYLIISLRKLTPPPNNEGFATTTGYTTTTLSGMPVDYAIGRVR